MRGYRPACAAHAALALLAPLRADAQFYTDKTSGDLRPGKQGIALSPEQWDAVKRAMPAVDRMLEDIAR